MQPKPAAGSNVAPPQSQLLPQKAATQVPLQMPPALIQKANESESAIPRRLPPGEALAERVQEGEAPLIVQTQTDGGEKAKPPTRVSVVPPTDEPRKPAKSLPVMDARWVPKFRQPMVGSAEPSPLPMPNAAPPIDANLQKAPIPAPPIEIINQAPTSEPSESREAVVPKMEIRAPRPESANEVRYSNYMQVELTPSAPIEEEVRRATFGPAMPAVLELEPPPSRTITFGMPKPIQPGVRRERPGIPIDIPSIPLNVPTPSAEPTIMAAMKARLRRPHFLDAPIAKHLAVKKQAIALEFAPVESDLEIVQYEAEDWPSAIAPFIVVQEAATGLLPANTAALEPERQIIVYRRADEAARPLAELGPPVIVEP